MIRKNTFRYIEQEIYDFKETQKKLNELTLDIIERTPIPQEIRTPEPKDPTGLSASILATHKERMRMIDTVYAIQSVIQAFDPEIFDVLEDKYWTRSYLTWQQAAEFHHVDRTTIYRWRTAFVGAIAKKMGIS